MDIQTMNSLIWVDYLIIAIISISAIIGLFRGLVKEAFSLGTWLVAIWVAMQFSRAFSVVFNGHIDTPSVKIGVAFVCLLLVALILGSMLSFLVSQLVDKTGLSGTDRFAGLIFGIARGAVVMAVLVLGAGLTPLPQDPWWNESVLITPFQDLSVWLRTQVPESFAGYLSY